MAIAQELVAKFKADTSDFNRKVTEVNKNIQKTSYSVERLAEKQTKLEQKNQRLINSQLRLDASTQRANASALKASIISQKAIEQAERFSKKNKEQSSSLSLYSSSLTNHAAGLISIGTAVAIVMKSISIGTEMEASTKRIEGMLGSVEKANYVISQMREIGYSTGASVLSLSASYGKLATFVENGSVSLGESIQLQRGLTSTATALGASNEQLKNVMYGLSQAMGAGIVRAEDFNQVTEPLPGIINRMEQATGLASGELRKMINDGLITSEMFKKILIPALGSFESQAVKMTDTFKVQSGILSNTLASLGEDIYDNLAEPMAYATKMLNNYLQQFVSVQRASKAELQRRSNDNQLQIMSLQANLASTGDNTFKSALDKKVQEQFEIDRQLASFMTPKIPPKADKNTEPKINIDPETQAEINKLREKLKAKGGKGSKKTARTPEQKQADEELRIRENAIASAKQSIATSEAEVETMRMLSHEKKIAIELRKLEAVGISASSEQYQALSKSLTEAYTAEMRMREKLDLEKYARDKKNENEAIADQAKFIGMTSHEISQYNLHKQLQIDLEEKSLTLTKEGFEIYKKTAEEMVERQSQLMEQNKIYAESFEGGMASVMTKVREDMLTQADIVTQGYEIMSSNISDTLVGMAQGSKDSFKDMARSIISDIQNIIMKALIMRAVTGIMGSFMPTATADPFAGASVANISPTMTGSFGGARANGGNVTANKSYLVGERGPEILTMGGNSGYIHSNDKAFGNGNNGSMVVNIDARGATHGVEQDIRRVMNEVVTLRKQVPNMAITAVREQNSRSSSFLR